jgi:hemerythrin
MALIEWRDEFCTGVKGVDYEHQELIKQINAIYEMIDDNADKENVLDSLGDIYGSISAHFALEEQMMERHDYDYFKEHQADHERLLDDIQDISDAYEKAEKLDDERFKKRLNGWFQIHFATHDSRLHALAHLINHEVVCESTMKTMIQNAKNTLLGKRS